jgi:PAS domain S-box-containing protein
MILTSAYRISQGGAAAFTGVCVIIASGVIGLTWRRTLRRPLTTLTWRNLLSLGYTVHVVMLALMFTLPWETAVHVLGHIALPVLTIYPLGTAAIGALMVNRLRHEQATEVVKQSEMQFRALSEQAAIGVTKAETASGRYVFVNQRFADIVGYARDELLTMSFHGLTYPDDLADDLDNVGRLVKGELHEYSMEKRYLRKDGKAIWVDLTVSPLWQEGESPQYLIGLVEDISERKRTEEALRQSEDKYRMLTESIKDVVWTLDTETLQFLYVSPSVQRLRGYTPEEVMAQPVEASLMPEGAALVKQEIHRQVEDFVSGREPPDRFLTTEVEQPCKDGSTVWTEAITSYYRDEQTGHVVVRGVSRDITERRNIASALAASRAALLEAQTIAHIGDWSMDTGTRAFTWSDELYAIHGIQPGSPMAHNTYLELIHSEDRQRVLEVMQWGMAGRVQEFVVDYRIVRPDGSERFLTLTGKTLSDGSGRLTALRGTMQDITDRKRAEAEKEAIQAQLLQSQKMEAIGELAGGVAHDFNNLLTGILGNVALVRDALPASGPLVIHLDAAETAARRAADLTRGLLTFSRSAMVVPVAFGVSEVVGETLHLLRQSLPATISIVQDFQSDVWNILADRSQITQIILNLAVNARDAMQGKGTLTFAIRNEVVGADYVKQHPYAQVGEHVHLSVHDTRPGIPDAIMHHLFEPFHTTKPVGLGTGLGLSIVYGAVKQAGGWITATSMPSTGTTFDIFLSRCLSPAVAVWKPGPVDEYVCHGTVLVVEDEPIVATVAQSLLERSGCTVALARNGAQALETLSQRHGEIDLILLDMTMPGMSTEDVVRGIRSLDAHVPILLNSGYTSGDAVKHMLDDGSVQGFLGKPYDLNQLLDSVLPLLPR